MGHVPRKKLHECGCLICHRSLKKPHQQQLSPQVILIASSDNQVISEFQLAQTLSKKTGCEVWCLKGNKKEELETLLEEKDLMWKEVAYIGERAKYLSKWKCLEK